MLWGSGRGAGRDLGVAPCASEFHSASRPAPPTPTTAHHTGPASSALSRIDSEAHRSLRRHATLSFSFGGGSNLRGYLHPRDVRPSVQPRVGKRVRASPPPTLVREYPKAPGLGLLNHFGAVAGVVTAGPQPVGHGSTSAGERPHRVAPSRAHHGRTQRRGALP